MLEVRRVRVSVPDGARRALLHGRVAVPSPFTATVTLTSKQGAPLRARATLTIEVRDNGTPAVRAVNVEHTAGGNVSSEHLRRVPVSRILDASLRLAGRFTITDEGWLRVTGGDPSAAEAREAVAQARGYRPRSDKAVREVAREYRRAVRAGEPPTEAVRRLLGCQPRTAREWVKAAEERGFLPATTRGRIRDDTTSGRGTRRRNGEGR